MTKIIDVHNNQIVTSCQAGESLFFQHQTTENTFHEGCLSVLEADERKQNIWNATQVWIYSIKLLFKHELIC